MRKWNHPVYPTRRRARRARELDSAARAEANVYPRTRSVHSAAELDSAAAQAEANAALGAALTRLGGGLA